MGTTERSVYKDKGTGYEIALLTGARAHSRKTYFSCESWTSDDRHVIFERFDDAAGMCVMRADEESGEVAPLTPYGVQAFGMAREEDLGYYFLEGNLVRLNTRTGACDPVGRLPDGCRPLGHYTVSKSGLVVNSYRQRNCIFMLLVTDPRTGVSTRIYQSDVPLGHCQFCPGDDQTVFYVHETGGDALQRMWMFDIPSGTGRPFYVEREGDHITHETWDAAGEYLTFIHWPKAIYKGMKSGNEFSVIAHGEYHHCAPSRSGLLVAADRMSRGEVVLVDACSGREHVLATNQFPATGPDHCHPSFNRKGDRICFTAPGDGKGFCQVAVMDLSQVKAF